MIDVSKLSAHGTNVEKYYKGKVIFYDGSPANDKMYIIMSGSAGIYKNYGQQGEICVATLLPGDFFGEMSLFLQKDRSATIVAAENTSVFTVSSSDVLEFLQTNPETTFSFIQTLCTRLYNTNDNAAIDRLRYVQDISVLNNEKLELETTANTDSLTGIYNRRYFIENAGGLVDAANRRNRLSYIVFFDLDHFKKVNDTYGHPAGDQVLIGVSDIVAASTRASDIFARYGGEEFILLINCAQPEDVMPLVERIRLNICADPIEHEDMLIRITTSIGIAPITNSLELIDAISNADQALYQAKKAGRNRTVLYEG